MPSPFPGMDPYLEDPARWPEVHGGLIWRIHEALNSSLPERYVAHVDRYVWLEEASGEERVRDGVPDVFITDRGTPSPGGAVTFATPRAVVVPLPTVRQERNRFVRIVDNQRRRVVTVLELLSYSNKEPGTDREAYLLKRREYLAMRANLVEFDLLRSGERMPGSQDEGPNAYVVLVCLAANLPNAGLWGFSVRDPIPAIPIPLDPADAPVPLDLKPILDRAYDAGRYASEIDYAQPPSPPLRHEDAAWAQQLLAARTHQGASS